MDAIDVRALDFAYAGGPPVLRGLGLTVDEILVRRPDAEAARRERLLQVLDVDRAWRMCRVSDGQRRRVQLLLGLLWPCEVLLLDEVTTDLDVIARGDLLAFLRAQK